VDKRERTGAVGLRPVKHNPSSLARLRVWWNDWLGGDDDKERET